MESTTTAKSDANGAHPERTRKDDVVIDRILLAVWALAPATFLAVEWLSQVPPVWGLGFAIAGYAPLWASAGVFLALVVGSTTGFWRSLARWSFFGLLGGLLAFGLLNVPLAWRLPTVAGWSWDRWETAARATDDAWFQIPDARSLNSDGYFVRASYVDDDGVGQVLIDDLWPIEFEPRYQVHERDRVPGVRVYVSYPVEDDWWYVWRR